MSKISQLDETQSRLLIEECWNINSESGKWFPTPIIKWIKRHATILGVPDEYLSIPLLVSTAHLSHHTCVEINELYKEPLVIYSIVAGRSGTNKSGSLGLMTDIVEEIKPDSIFDSGTIDGLAKSLEANHGNVISINDEFANFMESLDNGNQKKNTEKSRILTLYNATNWSKRTKTCGSYNIEDPRFNIIGFTQPDYLFDVARNPANLRDGFFQVKFLITAKVDQYKYYPQLHFVLKFQKY